MAQVAASWALGKVSPSFRPDKKKKPDTRSRKAITNIIECPEHKGPGVHGAFGMCVSCYGKWRRKQNKGLCSICGSDERRLVTKNPGRCTTCWGRWRLESMTPEERELEFANRRAQAKRKRERIGDRLRANDSIRKKQRRINDPAWAEAERQKKRDEYHAKIDAMTPEKHEAWREEQRRKRAEGKARRAAAAAAAAAVAEAERRVEEARRAEEAEHLRRVGTVVIRRVEVPQMPAEVFADALAARRIEQRPDKKYRRRHAA